MDVASPWDALRLTPTVETAYGDIAGFTSNGVCRFLGIPYGSSTGGAGRFRPPASPEPWIGPRLATQYGLSAPQRGASGSPLFAWYRSPYGFSEDCLNLNIFTPRADQSRRPVLVWLHGGGFAAGSGTSFAFDGGNMAFRDEVVVVSLNHRLNLFGFLQPEGDVGEAFTPNLGMLDIVAALEWVRDHIASFGGDPDNVTLFGESGGGAKVGVLMGMPSAVGLFHKAIIQSAGAGYVALTLEEAHANAHALFRRLGLSVQEREAVRMAPMSVLLKAYGELLPDGTFSDLFRPVVDGGVLPENPFSPNPPAFGKGIPLIIGCTAQESTFALAASPSLFDMGREEALGRTATFLGSEAAPVFTAYEAACPSYSSCEIYVKISNDYRFRQRLALAALKRLAVGGAPTYVYDFRWRSPALEGQLQAVHTLELPFVFDNTDRLSIIVGDGPDLHVLASQMRQAWTSFAKNANPNHERLPAWTPFSKAARETMVFDRQCECIEDHPTPERRMLLPMQPQALRL